jgi:hypothetical protein
MVLQASMAIILMTGTKVTQNPNLTSRVLPNPDRILVDAWTKLGLWRRGMNLPHRESMVKFSP